MSALSQTAPAAVLPILAPEEVVISGAVSANNCAFTMRRPRSMPVTILPHWSEPPICRMQFVALVEFDEVVGLQHHVIEFDERKFLLAIEPQFHRIERQHAVDREMPADVAQEIDVVERVQPVGIVRHHGVAAMAALEFQELREDRADALEVLVDRFVAQDAPALVLAARDRPPRVVPPPISAIGLWPVRCIQSQHHDRQQ